MFEGYNFFTSASRDIKNAGGSVNREIDNESQLKIFNKHINNLLQEGNSIFDRCLLDAVAFATDAYIITNNNDVFLQIVNWGRDKLKASVEQGIGYDHIFYLEPIPNMEQDGVRDINELYRRDVVAIYEELMKEIPIVHKISGTVEERANQIIKTIYG